MGVFLAYLQTLQIQDLGFLVTLLATPLTVSAMIILTVTAYIRFSPKMLAKHFADD
jgi:hypothetical protein